MVDLFDVNSNGLNSKLHSKFNIINNNLPLHKKVIQDWFEGFDDRDNKIIKEFQTTFHSSFWEIYLFAVFKKLNYSIDMSISRPDFMLYGYNQKVLIEATTANIKKNGEKESTRSMLNYLSMFSPPYEQKNFKYELNESIVRYSNALLNKLKLYEENYKKCDWVNKEDPFVIAIGSYAQVDYGREYIYGMMALLFGLYFEKQSMSYTIKDSITKNDSQSTIPLGIFLNESFKDVSAIIFSCTTTIGKVTATIASKEDYVHNTVFTLYQDLLDRDTPYKINIVTPNSAELLEDGLFIFHNPNASNPLDLKFFNSPGITQIYIDKNMRVRFIGNLCPTIARLDISNVLVNVYSDYIFRQVEAYNYKGL